MSAIDLLCCLPVSNFYYYLFKVVGLSRVQIKSATIIMIYTTYIDSSSDQVCYYVCHLGIRSWHLLFPTVHCSRLDMLVYPPPLFLHVVQINVCYHSVLKKHSFVFKYCILVFVLIGYVAGHPSKSVNHISYIFCHIKNVNYYNYISVGHTITHCSKFY